MKKLTGMKSFSSLENKKLEKMGVIVGGMASATNIRWTADTGNGSDSGTYVDNKLIHVVYA